MRGPPKRDFSCPAAGRSHRSVNRCQSRTSPNILPLPDSRPVLVATSGYNAHELSLIDLEKKAVVDRQAVRESWFGLAASP
jgi:hypothetical protein